MATPKKSSKTSGTKKAQVKVSDLKPVKDAKGGGRRGNKRTGFLAERRAF